MFKVEKYILKYLTSTAFFLPSFIGNLNHCRGNDLNHCRGNDGNGGSSRKNFCILQIKENILL